MQPAFLISVYELRRFLLASLTFSLLKSLRSANPPPFAAPDPKEMFRIEPADPDRLRTIGAPDDGCVAKKETAPRNDNGNQCQLCPQRVLQKPAEIVAHYVLRHQLPYCHICSMVFNSEVARMTHENLQHWPYKCVKCRSQFLHTAQRQQHMRNVHAIIECDLCPKTAESRPKYDDHLRRMHRCQLRTHDDASDAFRTAIAAPVLPTNDDGLQPIRQYLCHMCCRVHSVVHMLSHFLRYHAVGLNQLLAMLLRFQQNANEQVLSRFGACAPQKPPSGPLDALSFVDVAGNFELRELDHNNGHELTTAVSRVATTDFDTQLVKYVAASDDDGDDEDDKDVVVDNASIVCRTTERRYRCPYCEKGTEFNRTTLGRHMSGVHGFQLQNMEYRCQHCLRYFVQLQSLRQHYMREHGVDDASPSCPLCQQSVGTKKELRYVEIFLLDLLHSLLLLIVIVLHTKQSAHPAACRLPRSSATACLIGILLSLLRGKILDRRPEERPPECPARVAHVQRGHANVRPLRHNHQQSGNKIARRCSVIRNAKNNDQSNVLPNTSSSL